jgi:hypothetical protein
MSWKVISSLLRRYLEALSIDSNRMQHLCRGTSLIMFSFASKSQSHIGSLQFDDNCSIILENRALCSALISISESEGALRALGRTYTTSMDFMDDMPRFGEGAFRTQQNV